MLGTACDGPDPDSLPNGTYLCVGGALFCDEQLLPNNGCSIPMRLEKA